MPERCRRERPRSTVPARVPCRHAFRAATLLVVALLIAALPAFAAKKSYRYEDDPIRLGKKAFSEGRVDDARKYFDDAIQNEWQADQARFGLGEILRQEAKYAEAESMLRQAILDRNTASGGNPYPEARAALGLVLLRQDRKDEARKELTAALDQKGGLWEANFGMARILIDEKNWNAAENFLEKGKGKKGIGEREDLYRYGMARVEFGKATPESAAVSAGDAPEAANRNALLDSAEKNALIALEMNPNEPEYLTLVADIYRAKKTPVMAIAAYEKALSAPGVVVTPQVHQIVGQLYEGEKQYTDALRHYKEALQTDSTFAPAYKTAGRLYNLAMRYQDAASYYLKYTQLKAEDPEGQLGLAEAFYKMGGSRKAQEAAEKAYAIDSTDSRVRLLLARTTFMSNDMTRSERFYSTVPDTGRYEPADFVKLAQIAIAQKNLERADTLLAIALAKDSTQADAYSAKGKIHLNRKEFDAAAVNFEKSLAMSPGSAPTKINLGLAYLQLKRPQEAARTLREAVALSPDFAPARVFLGQALVNVDSLSAALGEYKKGLELDPKNSAALRGAAFVYMKRKEFASAVPLLRTATGVDSLNADNWVTLGQAQYGTGNTREAIKAVEKGLELNPNHDLGKKILDALKKASKPAGN